MNRTSSASYERRLGRSACQVLASSLFRVGPALLMLAAGLAACQSNAALTCTISQATVVSDAGPRAPTVCRTDRSRFLCGSVCVDVRTDPANCGTCGYRCRAGTGCGGGQCASVTTGPAMGGDPGTWTETGPLFSGRLDAIWVQRAAGGGIGTLLVGTPGGGVWRSTDDGDTFSWPGNYALGSGTILDIQEDRFIPGRVYAREWNGVWVTTDMAATWTRLLYTNFDGGDTSYPYPSGFCGGAFPLCGSTPPTTTLMVEPRPFDQWVVPGTSTNVLLNSFGCGGLQYSYDQGATWYQDWPGATGGGSNPDNCIIATAGDETTGYVYIATAVYGDIFRTRSPWPTTPPLPSTLQWDLVAPHGMPSASPPAGMTDTVPPLALTYAGSATCGTSACGRIIASTDNNSCGSCPSSTAWVSTYDATLSPPISWSAAADIRNGVRTAPTIRSVVWGGRAHAGTSSQEIFLAGNGDPTVYYSQNLGASWTSHMLDGQHGDTRGMYADGTIAIGGSSGYVWTGTDQNDLGTIFVLGSYPWTPSVSVGAPTGHYALGIRSWQSYGVAMRPPATTPPRILLGAQDVVPGCSDDAGSSWSMHPVATAESQSIVFHPGDSTGNLVYLYGVLGDLWQSTTGGGATCAALDGSFRNIFVASAASVSIGPHSLAVHPTNLDEVAVIDSQTLNISTNARAATPCFKPSSLPADTFGHVHAPTAVYIEPGTGYIYLGTLDWGVWRCTDTASFCSTSTACGAASSTSWTQFGTLPSTSPRLIASIAQASSSGTSYWLFGSTDGVYRMPAGGTTWTQVLGGNGYAYNEVAVDPTRPCRVYAGIGYVGNISRSRGGVNFSSTGGAVGSWNCISCGFGLHEVPITQIFVDAASPSRVLASTFGRGLWTYDWSGALPSCTP